MQEGIFDFDANDSVPDGDEMLETDSEGLRVIFIAARGDPLCEHPRGKLDVATDGNFQCNRKLAEKEKQRAEKHLPGRPNTKNMERPIENMQAAAKATAQSKSRCKAVTQVGKLRLRARKLVGSTRP